MLHLTAQFSGVEASLFAKVIYYTVNIFHLCTIGRAFVVVDCGALGSPQNGAKVGTKTTYLSTSTFTCNPGYARNGSSSRTCLSDGSWNGVQPTCDGVYFLYIYISSHS